MFQDQTVDRGSMYKNPAIEAVIRGQWFMKGRSDLRAYNHMVSEKSISLEVFALAATVVRHCVS